MFFPNYALAGSTKDQTGNKGWRQSKTLLDGYNLKWFKQLKKLTKNMVSILTGPLTGHYSQGTKIMSGWLWYILPELHFSFTEIMKSNMTEMILWGLLLKLPPNKQI